MQVLAGEGVQGGVDGDGCCGGRPRTAAADGEEALERVAGRHGRGARRAEGLVRRDRRVLVPNVDVGSGVHRVGAHCRADGSRLRAPDGESGAVVKGPDPEEFVIGDDASDISRTATPRPQKDATEPPVVEDEREPSAKAEAQDKQDASLSKKKGKEKQETDETLPEDVRKKLTRLDNLTAKYQGMLSDL